MAFEGSVIFSLTSGTGVILNVEGNVYLMADGRQVAKALYPNLYSVLSGSPGVPARYGETAANFVLPDIRGYYLRGDSLDSNRDPDLASRVLYGPGVTASGVGTYQPAGVKAHQHYQGGVENDNKNPPAASNTGLTYSSPQPQSVGTSGVTLNSMWPAGHTQLGASGIGKGTGFMNPPSYSYYAYIKAA